MTHSCAWCSTPKGLGRRIHSNEDARLYAACFDARFTPVVLRLGGIAYGFEQMARSL